MKKKKQVLKITNSVFERCDSCVYPKTKITLVFFSYSHLKKHLESHHQNMAGVIPYKGL